MGAVVGRTRWRDLRVIRAIHLMLAAEHRRMSDGLDESRLIRALERPRALVRGGDGDSVRLAAAYAFAIARSRALASGNAALGLAALDMVLRRGHLRLDCAEAEAAAVLRAVETGALGGSGFEAWVRTRAAPG